MRSIHASPMKAISARMELKAQQAQIIRSNWDLTSRIVAVQNSIDAGECVNVAEQIKAELIKEQAELVERYNAINNQLKGVAYAGN